MPPPTETSNPAGAATVNAFVERGHRVRVISRHVKSDPRQNVEAVAADALEAYEARIAALERLVGKQALEIEYLKGALKHPPRARSATTSVITGPGASPSLKDVG